MFLLLSVNIAKSQTDTAETPFKFYINAGAFFPETETQFQADGEHGVGTLIFLEHFLNADKNPFVFTANAWLKVTKRSSFTLRYFHYLTEGHIETSESQITIRDSVISLGAKIDSRWTIDYLGLNYNYSIFARPTWNAGLSFGIRTTLFDFVLDYETPNRSGSYDAQFPIPVALLGLFIDGYMTPKLRGTYSFEMFRLTISGLSGLVYENRFGLEYYFLKNMGAGFSFNQFLYRIDDVPLNDNFNGHVSYNLSGLQLNLHARF
jgi:hypothetical protein